MRVLITNLQLWPRSGTVSYVRDLAFGLVRRGASAAVFSHAAGPVCEELVGAGIPVTSRLRDLPWTPDVIHGHHGPTLRLALHAFPGVPAINICHDHTSPHERAVIHPAVRRHFGVSALCLRRQLADGVPPGRTTLLSNFVDVSRFAARLPLPPRPRRALVFSNYATEATQLPAVREACARAGISLDVVGHGVGNPIADPEAVLPRYDVVFAKAKAALEAMAVGAAVVLCDFAGVGPLVTSSSFGDLQPMNFGREALTEPLAPEPLLRQLARFDADDPPRVRALVHERASLDRVLDVLLDAYAACVREGVPATREGRDGTVARLRHTVALRAYWHWMSMPPERQALLRTLRVNAAGRAGLSRLLVGRRPTHDG